MILLNMSHQPWGQSNSLLPKTKKWAQRDFHGVIPVTVLVVRPPCHQHWHPSSHSEQQKRCGFCCGCYLVKMFATTTTTTTTTTTLRRANSSKAKAINQHHRHLVPTSNFHSSTNATASTGHATVCTFPRKGIKCWVKVWHRLWDPFWVKFLDWNRI